MACSNPIIHHIGAFMDMTGQYGVWQSLPVFFIPNGGLGMDWSIWYADPHDFRTTLLFLSGIIWLVFFVDAVPWRNLKSLRGQYMLIFLISMYFIQFLSLVLYAFSYAYILLAHKFGADADVVFMWIMFINWFIWLMNMLVSREALSRGYKKRGRIGLLACVAQLFVYLFVLFRPTLCR